MALRVKRSLGYGKFRSIVSLTILVLQVAVVGLADADGNDHKWASTPKSAYEPIVGNVESSVEALSASRKQNWGLSNQIRGGRLGENQFDNQTDVTNTTVVLEKPNNPTNDYSSSEYSFSIFQEGDGSKEDPDGIPDRYLRMQKSDRQKAKKAFEATVKWRRDKDINTILARPHEKFDVCKKVFPHFFCGRDDTDHVILLQRPGLIDLPLGIANGLTGEDLLYHYIYEMEYLWHILEPAANATMTSVIDLTGLNFSVLRKPELLHVVQLFCSTMDAHFPLRAHKTLLINAPKWFGAIFKLISPLLRESTKQNIKILSKGRKQDETLSTLGPEILMPYNGKLEGMPPSEMERDLRNFVSTQSEERKLLL